MIDPTGEQATSCVQFLRSARAQERFRELMEGGGAGLPKRERRDVQGALETYEPIRRDVLTEGLSIAEACRRHGVKYSAYVSYAYVHGWSHGDMGRKPTVTEQQIEAAVAMREAGAKWDEIADRLGIKKGTIYQAYRRRR